MNMYERKFRLECRRTWIVEDTSKAFTGIKHGVIFGAIFIAIIALTAYYFTGRIS